MRKLYRQWRHRERRPVDLNEVRFGATRWSWVKMAYVMLAVGFAGGLFLLNENFKADKQEQLQNDYEACVLSNDSSTVLRQIVELTPDGTPIVFPRGDLFDALDTATQDYFINIEHLSESQDDPSFRDLALELIPVRHCAKEFPTATHHQGDA